MDPRRTRVMLAAAGILVVIAAGAWLLKESSTPLAQDRDAANADAEAEADAAKAEADAATAEAATRGATTTTKETEAGVRASGTVNLDERSDGKTIELSRGQSVVVMLSATPSSGFDWAVTKAPPALGAPSMGFVSGGADVVGAAGKRRIAWTLKDALPPGEHPVELGYARSFEPGVAPFKAFRFKVRAVRP